MPEPTSPGPSGHPDWLVPGLRALAFAAGALGLVVAVLVLVSALQLAAADPLGSAALKTLKQRVAEDGADEALYRDIRNFDLLARKAYFTSRDQQTSGTVIFILSWGLCFGLLQLCGRLEGRPAPLPRRPAAGTAARLDRAFRTGILILAGCLTLACLASLLLVPAEAWEPGGSARPGAGVAATGADSPAAAPVSAGPAAAPPAAPASGAPAPSQAAAPPQAAAAASPSSAAATDFALAWPRQWGAFRGPRAGIAVDGSQEAEMAGLAAGWHSGAVSVLWRTRLDLAGLGSPVVWDRTAFLNAADESRQLVQAFDTGDGRLLWTADLARLVGPAAGKPEISPNSGLATPTMCCDAEREYVIFPTGRLAALDRQGKLLWSKELGLPDNSYGLASSLALWRNILIVQFDQTERSVLLAFDARTGAHRWESVRESEASWSSPLLVSQAGTSRIIVAGNPNLAAYKPEDGSLAWEFPILGGEVAPSPAWYGDTVFVANMYALAAAIPLAGAEAGKPAVRWEYYDDLPDISSPLASAYGLYFCTTRGKLSCLDSATGGVLWQYDAKEEINASPLLLGRQVLVATTAGRLLAFPVQAPAKLAWTLDLGMPVQATPAWHDGRLFVRSARELIALGPK